MRDTGAIGWDILNRPGQVFFFFMRMKWPDPLGILRWSTYSNGGINPIHLLIDPDEGAQDWDTSRVFTVGDLTQSDDDFFTINDVSVGNADGEFASWVRKYGWMDMEVAVWVAYFQNAPPFDFVDSVKLYDGTGDRFEANVPMANGSLLPGMPIFQRKFPRRMFTPAFGFKFIPPAGLKFNWGSVQVALPAAQALEPDPSASPAPPWWLPNNLVAPDPTISQPDLRARHPGGIPIVGSR